MLTPKQAAVLTKRLDKIANYVQRHYDQFGMSKKAAYNFCLYVDQTSDHLEKVATTLERDPDEPYMDSFNTPKSPVEMEPDEPYMMEYDNDRDDQLMEDDDLTPGNEEGEWVAEGGYWDDREATGSNWYERGE